MNTKFFKISALLICFLMAFSFASCNSEVTSTSATTHTQPGIYFELVRSTDTKGVLKYATNLAEGMLLTVSIANNDSQYNKTVDATVVAQGSKKYVTTEEFTMSDGKTVVEDGKYAVVIESKLPSEQPESVIEAIGDRGQKLVGRNVYAKESQYITKVITTVSVKDGVFESVSNA